MNKNGRAIVDEDLDNIIAADLPFESFHGTTTLVTGAGGFLAASLVEALLALNRSRERAEVRVIGVVRDAARARVRFAAYADDPALVLIEADVGSAFDIPGPVDFIVHAASQASPKYFVVDPIGTLAPNVFGTRFLLEFAERAAVKRFLFISSGEVYGVVPEELIPIRESTFGSVDPIVVRSCYAESKRMGEALCAAFAHQRGVGALVARPFHTYGPGIRLDDGRVFADFVADVLANRDIAMKSDGQAIRPYCYVSDAVVGFLTILLKGTPGEAYNVGNDRAEMSVLGLAELLVTLFPERGLKVVRQPRSDVKYMQSPIARNCPDVSKLQALGWSPKVTVEEGFRRTIASFLPEGPS